MILEVLKSIAVIFAILWVIFYAVGFKIKKKISNDEKMIYECGFKNFNNLGLKTSFNFMASVCLILIYELEILFLVPVSLNLSSTSPQTIFFVFLFLAVMSMTLLIDKYLNVLKWTY